ncbi:MAG: hypothetical protein Q7S58_11185 [Candidatus Binatus sp.]|uniref:hypothetical protein n=1 Tax=Candidatus Binatus sp. TaxID=2811406 RepID=UPI002716F60A|nr:hypothetical protein [Candidatus Binatus sp.]MDO8432960.1 hypothetical protein [Candidatus Binatus sp.]
MPSRSLNSLRVAMLLIAAASMPACLQPANPYVIGPYPHSHQERQLDLRPMHTVCDNRGENCMACDPGNTNCRRFPMGGIIASDASRQRL